MLIKSLHYPHPLVHDVQLLIVLREQIEQLLRPLLRCTSSAPVQKVQLLPTLLPHLLGVLLLIKCQWNLALFTIGGIVLIIDDGFVVLHGVRNFMLFLLCCLEYVSDFNRGLFLY